MGVEYEARGRRRPREEQQALGDRRLICSAMHGRMADMCVREHGESLVRTQAGASLARTCLPREKQSGKSTPRLISHAAREGYRRGRHTQARWSCRHDGAICPCAMICPVFDCAPNSRPQQCILRPPYGQKGPLALPSAPSRHLAEVRGRWVRQQDAPSLEMWGGSDAMPTRDVRGDARPGKRLNLSEATNNASCVCPAFSPLQELNCGTINLANLSRNKIVAGEGGGGVVFSWRTHTHI